MALFANPLPFILAKSKSAASSLLPSSNASQTPIYIAVTSQPSSSPPPPCSSSSSSPSPVMLTKRRRGWMLLWTTALLSPIISSNISRAQELAADTDEDEDEQRLIRLFQDTTASVVCIRDLQLVGDGKGNDVDLIDDNDEGKVKVDGVGSGFIWDKMGHIVTNYHVISKFATDRIGRQRCKVYLLDSSGNTFSKEGNLIGTDPTNDLAVLKVDVKGDQLRPAVIGTSRDLRVGQSCFTIGNPYGYEHTLTTGVVSGLGREIPSQNGQSIRGAIQTDAAINAGNSGGPLIDSHGHVIGVNTATFSRKGTGLSSGVNFAIPVDLAVRTIPYLIVHGTSTTNRF